MLRLPHIWHLKEYLIEDHQLRAPVEFKGILEMISALSSLVITNSKSLANYFNAKLPSLCAKYIYYSFSSAPQNIVVNKKIFSSSSNLKLLVLGQVQPGKGQDLAVTAVKKLINKNMPVELAIVGFSSRPSAFEKRIKNLAAECKNILIFKKIQNAWEAISQADVILIPSLSEAFGRVAIEAMQLAKPVIASDSGALPELVKNNYNGILFKKQSAVDLERAIETYLKDRRLIEKHGKRGLNFVEKNFIGERFIHQFNQFATKVIDDYKANYSDNILKFLLSITVPSNEQRIMLAQYSLLVEKINIMTHERIQINQKYNEIFEENNKLQKINTDLLAFRSKVLSGKIWKIMNVYFDLRDRMIGILTLKK